jgi:hypothetical protein
MFRRLWEFLLDESHQKALTLIGGAIAAVVMGSWALWQHFDNKSEKASKRVVEPASQRVPTATAPFAPLTSVGRASKTSSIHASEPRAETGDKGTAVVATDKAKVTINQTITGGDSSSLARKHPPQKTNPSNRGTQSGDKGISVDASGSSETNIRQEQR